MVGLGREIQTTSLMETPFQVVVPQVFCFFLASTCKESCVHLSLACSTSFSSFLTCSHTTTTTSNNNKKSLYHILNSNLHKLFISCRNIKEASHKQVLLIILTKFFNSISLSMCSSHLQKRISWV